MRIFSALLILVHLAWGIDYSQRSTQELIASLHPGGKNMEIILQELKKREHTMTQAEKKLYRTKLQAIKHVEKK